MSFVKMICGDCLEKMNLLDKKSVDMVLCDLPYGTTRNKWDSIIDLKSLWSCYSNIIKENTPVVLFAQTPFDKVLGYSNLEHLRYEWIWEKTQATGHLNSKKMPLKSHENILVFYKKLPVYNPQMRYGFKPYTAISGRGSTNYGKQVSSETISDGNRYPIDILKFSRDKEKFHPTQKPVKLLEYLIKTYTNENQIVLDNCAGSFSTGIACLKTNRNCILIEKDKNYFEIGKNRILDYIKNNNLQAEIIVEN